MSTFHLESQQWLQRPREAIFPFFADAFNLESITPPWLRFEVVSERPIEMRVGATIDYRLRIHGAPIRWRTRIAAWEPPYRFVDEQIRGPYRLWRHEHLFTAQGDRTLAVDRVDYAPIGGALTHALFVKRDVRRIFEYRRRRLEELFGGGPAGDAGAPAESLLEIG